MLLAVYSSRGHELAKGKHIFVGLHNNIFCACMLRDRHTDRPQSGCDGTQTTRTSNFYVSPKLTDFQYFHTRDCYFPDFS